MQIKQQINKCTSKEKRQPNKQIVTCYKCIACVACLSHMYKSKQQFVCVKACTVCFFICCTYIAIWPPHHSGVNKAECFLLFFIFLIAFGAFFIYQGHRLLRRIKIRSQKILQTYSDGCRNKLDDCMNTAKEKF